MPDTLAGVITRIVVPDIIVDAQGVQITAEFMAISGSASVRFRGRPPFVRFRILDSIGTEVWRTPGDAVFAITTTRVLKTGEPYRVSQLWYQRTSSGRLVSPGRYEVTGDVMLADGRTIRLRPDTVQLGR